MEGGEATGEFCPGLQLVSGLKAEAPAASSIKDRNTPIEQSLEYNYQRGNYVT